jgi:apolipoprotein N-acyltransferase
MQHFSQGLIRSVENGVPLVRACNTGVTAAVDSLGRVLAKLQNAQGDVEKLSGCLWVEVPKAHYTTFFSFFGDLPVLLISVMSIGVSIVRRKFFFRKLAVEIGLDENDERS